MARTRYVKPEFFGDTKLAREVSILARYFYIGLWTVMDRRALAERDTLAIKREVFPYDESVTSGVIEALLHELERAKRIHTFEAEGKIWIYSPKFRLHQKFHRDERPKHLLSFSDAALDRCCKGASTVQAMSDATASTPGNGNGERERERATENGELATGNGELGTGNGDHAMQHESSGLVFMAEQREGMLRFQSLLTRFKARGEVQS